MNGTTVYVPGDCPTCGQPTQWRIDYLHGETTTPSPLCPCDPNRPHIT
jgi:hypothetical protein